MTLFPAGCSPWPTTTRSNGAYWPIRPGTLNSSTPTSTASICTPRKTASLIYQVPPEQVTVEQRAIAKNSNFNFAFEGGPARVGDTSGISYPEAEQVYQAWHAATRA